MYSVCVLSKTETQGKIIRKEHENNKDYLFFGFLFVAFLEPFRLHFEDQGTESPCELRRGAGGKRGHFFGP